MYSFYWRDEGGSRVEKTRMIGGSRTRQYLAQTEAFKSAHEDSVNRANIARRNALRSATAQREISGIQTAQGLANAGLRAATSVGLTSSREATTRSGLLARANAANAAASMGAMESASQSSRLLTEFEAGLQFQRAQRERALDRSRGALTAGFGVSGIQASSAIADTAADARLSGASAESQANMRRQSILNQARSGITSAIASSVRAGGQLASGLISSYSREMGAVADARSSLQGAAMSANAQNRIAQKQFEATTSREYAVNKLRRSTVIPNQAFKMSAPTYGFLYT